MAVVMQLQSSRTDCQLPSVGSLGHGDGSCKPCAFFHTRGCTSGKECPFCHLCDANEKKTRQKAKRSHFQQLRAEASASAVCNSTAESMRSASPTILRPRYNDRRPRILELLEESPPSYVVRNTFIETAPRSSTSPSVQIPSRFISSCPSSKIGEMQIEVETECEDTDMSSCDFSSTVVDSPRSLSSMLWPATPDTLMTCKHDVFAHDLLRPSSAMEPHVDMPPAPRNLSIDLPPPPRNFTIDTSSSLANGDCFGEFSEFAWPTTPEPATLYRHVTLPLPAMQMSVPYEMSMPDMYPTQASTIVDSEPEVRPSVGRVLMLAEMINSPSDVETECKDSLSGHLPSVGSSLHSTGNCKPCGFFHKNGCKAGVDCTFCHLCDSGEKKRRQREKREMFRNAERLVTCSLKRSGN